MQRSPSDAAAMEAAMWADIADRLAIGAVRTSRVEVSEQVARCDLVAQRAAYIVALAGSMATTVARSAARTAKNASDLAREATAWQHICDIAADQADSLAKETERIRADGAEHMMLRGGSDNSSSAAEQRPQFAASHERASAAETRVLELHTREVAARADLESKAAQLQQLERDTVNLRKSIESLRQEEANARRSLEDRQRDSLDARRQLERDLEMLKAEVRAARDAAENAKIDATAANDERDAALQRLSESRRAAQELHHQQQQENQQRQQQQQQQLLKQPRELEDAGVVDRADDPYKGSAYRQEASRESFSTSAEEVSPRGTTNAYRARSRPVGEAGPPGTTIESGLAALQNVRNQLRDLRGQSSTSSPRSPQRGQGGDSQPSSFRHASPTNGAIFNSAYGSLGADGTPTLHRAQTYAGPSPHSGSSLIGAARLRTSASMILESNHAAGPSPWKQRLLKLQGDLRTLRSELGATGGVPAGASPSATR